MEKESKAAFIFLNEQKKKKKNPRPKGSESIKMIPFKKIKKRERSVVTAHLNDLRAARCLVVRS